MPIIPGHLLFCGNWAINFKAFVHVWGIAVGQLFYVSCLSYKQFMYRVVQKVVPWPVNVTKVITKLKLEYSFLDHSVWKGLLHLVVDCWCYHYDTVSNKRLPKFALLDLCAVVSVPTAQLTNLIVFASFYLFGCYGIAWDRLQGQLCYLSVPAVSWSPSRCQSLMKLGLDLWGLNARKSLGGGVTHLMHLVR